LATALVLTAKQAKYSTKPENLKNGYELHVQAYS